jgi:peptide/nickel transport system ATP-binding protein
MSLLRIDGLSISLAGPVKGPRPVTDDITLSLDEGDTLGIAGESGSGKSTLLLAMAGLIRNGLQRTGGDVRYEGKPLLGRSDSDLYALRGGKLAMVPQNAGTALTPSMRIETHMDEALRLHTNLARMERTERTLELLRQVRLPEPEVIAKRYPHQLSGGQLQRVAIAMALAAEPQLLLLDEPTSGLDVTTQQRIVELIRDIRGQRPMAAVCVSHDLGVLAQLCRKLAVMYAGRIVEYGETTEVLAAPRHPYVKALVAAVPRLSGAARAPAVTMPPVLRLENVAVSYRRKSFWDAAPQPPAVSGINLTVGQGEILALVGESGSGKSTVLRAIAGLWPLSGGTIACAGAGSDRERRRAVQMIFQNPAASLNPRHTVEEIIAQPLRLYFGMGREKIRDTARRHLASVELDSRYLARYPGQLSGGEQQRVAIARALAAEPSILLCDEVTSALDVSVQAAILDLIRGLSQSQGVAVLFVTHNLAVAATLANRIAVLHQGRQVETGAADELCASPREPYTRDLLAAAMAGSIERLVTSGGGRSRQ